MQKAIVRAIDHPAKRTDDQALFRGRIVEVEPLPISYLGQSAGTWSSIYRLLGALALIFTLAELVVTLFDPAQTFYEATFVRYPYPTADFDFADFFKRNWLVWLQAAAALFLAIGGFWCFLRPARMRLLVTASILLVLIEILYTALVLIAGWRFARLGQYGTVGAALKIASENVVKVIFPVSVICVARIRTRQTRS